MRYGLSCNPCSQRMSIGIASVAGGPVSLIAAVPMPFFTSSGPHAREALTDRVMSQLLRSDRFQQWVSADVFLKLWHMGVAQFDELQGLDWNWLSMDGAMTKAPLGVKKTGPNPTDRAKGGVKRSLLTEGHGIPIELAWRRQPA